jgi:hypothetical protein
MNSSTGGPRTHVNDAGSNVSWALMVGHSVLIAIRGGDVMIPGDVTTLRINHGDRPARVLAIRDECLLVEYQMPGGSTALQILTPTVGQLVANGTITTTRLYGTHSVGYYDLSTRWLRAIAEAEQEWIGHPRGCAPVPSVATLVQLRRTRRPMTVTHQGGQGIADAGEMPPPSRGGDA